MNARSQPVSVAVGPSKLVQSGSFHYSLSQIALLCNAILFSSTNLAFEVLTFHTRVLRSLGWGAGSPFPGDRFPHSLDRSSPYKNYENIPLPS